MTLRVLLFSEIRVSSLASLVPRFGHLLSEDKPAHCLLLPDSAIHLRSALLKPAGTERPVCDRQRDGAAAKCIVRRLMGFVLKVMNLAVFLPLPEGNGVRSVITTCKMRTTSEYGAQAG